MFFPFLAVNIHTQTTTASDIINAGKQTQGPKAGVVTRDAFSRGGLFAVILAHHRWMSDVGSTRWS